MKEYRPKDKVTNLRNCSCCFLTKQVFQKRNQEIREFKAPTFKSAPTNPSSNIQIASNEFEAPTIRSPPTNSKLQHSNLLQQSQSSKNQIASNKFKVPTFKSPPTNSKLQHSNLLQQTCSLLTFAIVLWLSSRITATLIICLLLPSSQLWL